MPCEVCEAYPTWADLSDCEELKCPWKLDMTKPVPLLKDMHRNPPPFASVKPPTPVQVLGKPPNQTSAVVTTNVPQPHSFAAIVEKQAEGIISALPTPPKPLSFAEMVARKPPPEPLKTVIAPKKPAPVKPPKPEPVTVELSKKQQGDFDEIMRAVDRMNWSGSYGPSCQVKCRLKWDDLEGRQLYLAVKADLDDRSFTYNKKRLYYYITSLAPKLKAGFRITGHSKQRHSVGKAQTHGVLHIEN